MYRGTPDTACYHLPSCTGLSPSLAGFSKTVPLEYCRFMQSLPPGARTRVWALPVSLAATSGITVVFSSSGYLDVSVHRVRSLHQGNAVACIGLPHSEILGSKVICTSPKLIAACHVFLRLLKPRHPPSALVHFLCNVFNYVLVGTLLQVCRCCS